MKLLTYILLIFTTVSVYSAPISASYMLWKSATGGPSEYRSWTILDVKGIESVFEFGSDNVVQADNLIEFIYDTVPKTNTYRLQALDSRVRPTYVPNAINGYAVGDFYESPISFLDKLNAGPSPNPVIGLDSSFLCYIVYSNDATLWPTYDHVLLSSARSTSSLYDSMRIQCLDDDSLYMFVDDGTNKIEFTGSPVSTGIYNIAIFQVDPPQIRAWVNGSFYGSATNTAFYNNFKSYSDDIDVSAGNGISPRGTFKIAEIGIKLGVELDPDREILEGYLTEKYGLKDNLDISHPYKVDSIPLVSNIIEIEEPTEDGLISYWPMDEYAGVVSDVIGTNDMYAMGGVQFDAEYGVRGRGADFSGTNQYLTASTFTVGVLTNEMTISEWINIDNVQDYSPLFARWNDSGGKRTFALAQRRADIGGITFICSQNGTDGGGYTGTTNGLSNNTWIHIASTYSNGVISLYYDGSLVGIGTNASAPSLYQSGSDPVVIGGGANIAGARNFDGSIDEVRLYDRALTPEEIEVLYLYDSP